MSQCLFLLNAVWLHINSVLLHCSDALCMKLRNYKGKHDKYYTSFTLFSTIYIVFYALYL